MRDHSWKDYWASPYVPYRNWWKLWQVKWDITHAWWKVYFRSQVYVQCWKLWCVSVNQILWNVPEASKEKLAGPQLRFLHLIMIPTTLSDMSIDRTLKQKTTANISTKSNDYMYCAFVAFLNFFTAESFYSSPYTVRSSAKPIKTSFNTNRKLFYPCSCSCLSIVQAKHICFSVWLKNATYNNLCQCTK